uniref:Protein kinase domain-containing protein n=1 Tax=Kalanchoe fedtschenkoi TaxID=63787 RepID=A0A7N0UN61_KALFE
MSRISCLAIWALLLWFISSSSLCSCRRDDKYAAECRVPVYCGKYQVRYPFYLEGRQPSYCGLPGYNVSCVNQDDSSWPLSITRPTRTLNYYNTSKRGVSEVRPHSITYRLRILPDNTRDGFGIQVSHEAFSKVEETCTLPEKELEALLQDDLFHYNFTISNMVVMHCECNKTLARNLIPYSTSNCSDPILLTLEDAGTFSRDHVARECKRRLRFPMVDDGFFIPTSGGGGAANWSAYKTLMARRGFDLVCRFPSCKLVSVNYHGSECYCLDHEGKSIACPRAVAGIMKRMAKPLGFSICGVAFLAIVIILRVLPNVKIKENSKVITEFLRTNEESLSLKRYTYSEIRKMTRSFKDKLGQGGFGSVYKGELEDGRPVAVKILNPAKSNVGEGFVNEVTTISSTAHVNIVGLIGFCISGSKRALIYPFMANGSLEKFIYEKKLSGQQQRLLEWRKLHSIAVGIAQGLEYLHRGCTTRIVHFDIKPHNILLDEDLCPKISDFGLAKVCVRRESVVSVVGARGTVGYIAPEQACRDFGHVSHKSDVYSYGMMILEMVGGRKNVDDEKENASEIYFPHWIYKRVLLGQELELNGIADEDDRVRARKMIITGLWCIQTDPAQRPPIGRVVEMLQGSVESLPVPPKPYMYSPSSSPPHSLAPVLTSSTAQTTISDTTSNTES